VRRDQALEVVVGQAPVDAVIERCGGGIKISPDQGAPYAAIEDVSVRRLCWVFMRLCRDLCAVVI
jgi:hypothetical protein